MVKKMTIGEEIESLENVCKESILALVSKADDEDDLNIIYNALKQMYDAKYSDKSDYNPAGDIAPDIENNVIWDDIQTKYSREQIEEKWNVSGTWWDVGCIFLHPSGDLIAWNDEYEEFVRYDKEE
jgi:hypothetical protein